MLLNLNVASEHIERFATQIKRVLLAEPVLYAESVISGPRVPGFRPGTPAVTLLSMGARMTENDLFEIIRRQSEQIDQLIAEHKALKAEIARLKKRIEELERRERKDAAPSVGRNAPPIPSH
ncbi:hypothetical protein [Deinococcus ruber]|nr:hypothetical protein [Deinococcus ruber]